MQKRQGKNDSHSKFNKEKAWQRKSERFSKNHSHSSGCFFGSFFVSCTLASFKTGKECRHETLFENKIIHSKGSSNLLWAFSIQSIYLEVGERMELQGITNGINFMILFLLIKKKFLKVAIDTTIIGSDSDLFSEAAKTMDKENKFIFLMHTINIFSKNSLTIIDCLEGFSFSFYHFGFSNLTFYNIFDHFFLFLLVAKFEECSTLLNCCPQHPTIFTVD